MSRNNDVFKVLVTTGDQDLYAKNQALSGLALGQIGIFDAKTNLSIDETSTKPQSLYFAVGVDKNLDGVKDDIEFSAGQNIQVANTKNLNYRPHTPAKDQVVNIVGYGDANCDADYTVKFGFENQEIFRRQGFVQFTKTFSVRTACCVGTEVNQDGNKLSLLLRDAINADESKIFSSTIIARQAITIGTHATAANYSTGDVVTDADVAALIVFNNANAGSEVYTNLKITLSSVGLQASSNVNLKYYHPRQTNVITSLLESMTCIGGSVVVVTDVAYGEGKGYDVKQKEYHSQLNAAGPYILSEGTGTAKENIFYANATENYDQFEIASDFKTKSGWGDYVNGIRTIIAIPATSTTTRNAFAAALDVVFGGLGFDPAVATTAAANVNPAVLEPTSAKTVATDGLG